ncbi:MbcA/ParS/Xre antitoxin family protein [Pedobacter sp. MC2016-05]|uniref:MbcA/ParS/Xre antitoxin family protein n=1 Tax=Pedobacter sp. MC2016-05 TaxID=2994474 RepID=UPI002247289F|nr:MbcA/ParS/Xre antitoxin family protein [Pedobacter sp. MC2016-05]MCX2475724.1 MbcA/ParS/Xre antitoxin family protein [Pedobacter sp. MC2016-05]
MSIATLDKRQQKILEEIPTLNDFSKIYFYTVQSKFDNDFVKTLDSMIGLNDTILSDWLSITPRTFRNYKKNTDLILKGNIKEHIVLIISLYKHGIEVFGDTDNFEKWLSMKNHLLDNKAPTSFLDTVSGIKFIDNRLSALEYGENV